VNCQVNKNMTFKTFFENKNISYSGVVLDENSRKRLLSSPEIKNYLNPEHDLIAHHMTIKLGGLMGTPHEKRIDTVEDFFANSVGISDDGAVVAVGVDGISDNKKPHVTVGVDRKKGGKPVMSNYIETWFPLEKPIPLKGIVKEI
jgi:hypothetical protein